MRAKSIKGKSTEEIRDALQQSMADAHLPDGQGFQPTLAVVFLSVKQDRKAIIAMLQELGIAIFGATTAGEFVDEEIHNKSIVILLMELNPAYFRLLFAETSAAADRKSARDLASNALEEIANPSFIVAGSGLDLDADAVVRGIEDAAGTDVVIFGGIAADDLTMQDSYVFTNGNESTRGIILLALDADKITLKGRATCGWQAMGTVKTITKSEEQWIHTLDDQPALDTIIKFLGVDIERKGTVDTVLPKLGADYPLQLQRDQKDPVMRHLVYVNWEDHSVMVGGSIQQGDKIRFSRPADFDVIEQVISECNEVKNNSLPHADALIIFECAGRLISLGPMVGKEIEGVQAIYDVPMAGFFTYGEIGRTANGNHEHHNLTCCWVGLKEKNSDKE